MIINISLNKEEKGMVLSSKDPVLEVKGGEGVLLKSKLHLEPSVGGGHFCQATNLNSWYMQESFMWIHSSIIQNALLSLL